MNAALTAGHGIAGVIFITFGQDKLRWTLQSALPLLQRRAKVRA